MSRWHGGRIQAHTGCGKTGYTKPDAEKRATAMRRRYGEKLMPYRCHACNWWHVGHSGE